MAEAAAPERVDMEYRFARDIVNVLVSRKVANFQLDDFRENVPTPFCFRIRNAVEHYVTLEDIDIKVAVTDYQKSIPDYKSLVEYQREVVLPTISNLAALLKHLSILAMMAAWHRKWDDENAPDIAVAEIRRILVSYVTKYETPDIFWKSLQTAAPFITKRPLTPQEKEFKSKWF